MGLGKEPTSLTSLNSPPPLFCALKESNLFAFISLSLSAALQSVSFDGAQLIKRISLGAKVPGFPCLSTFHKNVSTAQLLSLSLSLSTQT